MLDWTWKALWYFRVNSFPWLQGGKTAQKLLSKPRAYLDVKEKLHHMHLVARHAHHFHYILFSYPRKRSSRQAGHKLLLVCNIHQCDPGIPRGTSTFCSPPPFSFRKFQGFMNSSELKVTPKQCSEEQCQLFKIVYEGLIGDRISPPRFLSLPPSISHPMCVCVRACKVCMCVCL